MGNRQKKFRLLLLSAAWILSGCGGEPAVSPVESSSLPAVSQAELSSLPAETQMEIPAEETEILKKDALFSGAASYGTDGECLDYIDEEILIYHNWYGLVIVQYAGGIVEPQIIDTLSLRELGCSATQGTDAGGVKVSGDGRTVYLYSAGKDDLYRYDLETRKLYQSKKDQLPDPSLLYQRPDTMSGRTNWGMELIPNDQGYFVNEDGRVQSLEFVLEGDMVISIWTESSRQYMMALKEAYDAGSETISDDGWRGSVPVPLVNIEFGWENQAQNHPSWFLAESQADENGNWISDPEAWSLGFENENGSKRVSYREHNGTLNSYQDYLIFAAESNAFYVVDATAADEPDIEDLEELLFAQDAMRLSGEGEKEETAAMFDDRTGILTFYDDDLSVICEWKNVRVEAFCDAPLCVEDLETGERFYLDERGGRVEG